jgi:hypothetical protein
LPAWTELLGAASAVTAKLPSRRSSSIQGIRRTDPASSSKTFDANIHSVERIRTIFSGYADLAINDAVVSLLQRAGLNAPQHQLMEPKLSLVLMQKQTDGRTLPNCAIHSDGPFQGIMAGFLGQYFFGVRLWIPRYKLCSLATTDNYLKQKELPRWD